MHCIFIDFVKVRSYSRHNQLILPVCIPKWIFRAYFLLFIENIMASYFFYKCGYSQVGILLFIFTSK